MPGDRRNRKTEVAIIDSFISLLSKKNISNITITEITEKADINRSTFYLHYTDIYHLSDSIQEHILEEIRGALRGCTKESENMVEDYIVPVLENLKKSKSFLLALGKNASLDDFVKKFAEIIYGILKSDEHFASKGHENFFDYFTAYLLGAIGGMVGAWLRDGCSIETRQIANMIYNLTLNGINYYVQEKKFVGELGEK